MTIQITSTAFTEGGKIPRIYTCDDQNISPPLSWTGVPTTTVSLAIIMDDPDAPSGTWVHWVLYNLPPALTTLEQGKTGIGTDGKNDFNRMGYGGPCPPRGSTHRYYIKLYALDKTLDLKSGSTKAQVAVYKESAGQKFQLVYTVDLEADVINKIEFLKTNNRENLKIGELAFSYLERMGQSDVKFAEPREKSYTAVRIEKMEDLWLMRLAENNLP